MSGILHKAGCCCGRPCECAEATPNATVSGATGRCGDQWNGAYTFHAFEDRRKTQGLCWWHLKGSEDWLDLLLMFCPEEEEWCAYIPNGFGYNLGTCLCPGADPHERITGVECVDGGLQGSFTLTGMDTGMGPGECLGQTVTVVLS